jgi:Domain of unknown function (DUF1707)
MQDEPMNDGRTGGGEARIGSAERDAAVAALRTHLEAGRLTPEEYEDRSVAASRARTWGDIAPLFADLPDPRPGPVAADLARTTRAGTGAFPALSDGVKERIMAVTPLAALVLFFVTRTWLWFLAIPIAGALLYGSERRRRR